MERVSGSDRGGKIPSRFSIGRIIVLAFALIAVMGRGAAAQTTEAVTNGDFENPYNAVSGTGLSGSIANGWFDNSDWQPGSVRVYSQSTDKYSGTYSQKVELTSNTGVAQLAQNLSWTPNESKEYTVTVRLKGASASGGTIPVEVLIAQNNAPYYVLLSRIVKVTSAWATYTFKGMTGTSSANLIVRTFTKGNFKVDGLTVTSGAAPSFPLRTSVTVPRAYEGMHGVHIVELPYVMGPYKPMGTRRLWGCDEALWSNINTASGTYDWTRLDRLVADAQARGVELVYTFGSTPTWASARPTEGSWNGVPGSAAEPANMQNLRNFVTALATRYAGKIKYYEFWNEPNEPAFFSGTPEKLKDVAQAIYESVKAVDSTAQVLGPCVTGGNAAAGYLHYFLGIGGGSYCDIISVHLYNLVGNQPESARFLLQNVKRVLEANNQASKAIWNTEQGWAKDYLLWTPDGYAPDDVGASIIARSLLLGWRYGYDRCLLYTWDDWNSWGAIQLTPYNQYETVTPAGQAYLTARQWMAGNRLTAHTVSGNGTNQFELTRLDGKKVYVLWNLTQTVNFSIPAAWGATGKWQLDGTRTALGGATTISVNSLPVLLEPASGSFYLTPRHATGKRLMVDGAAPLVDYTGLQQFDYQAGWGIQQFRLDWIGNGFYRIVNPNSGKAAEVSHYQYVVNGVAPGLQDGAGVYQFTIRTSDDPNQQWEILPTSGGYYRFINRQSDKALDVTGASTGNYAPIQQWTYGGGNNQQWSLTPF